MSMIKLPEKYMFNKELLVNYKPGDSFPMIVMNKGKREVDGANGKPESPEGKFIQFCIDTVINPSIEDIVVDVRGEENTVSPIEILKEYVSELEKVINYAKKKKISLSTYPIYLVVEKKKEVEVSLSDIIEVCRLLNSYPPNVG